MSIAGLVILLLYVCLELVIVHRRSHRRIVDDRQPHDVDRIAAWERRMGEYRAEQRRREHRARIACDARASVQAKVTPRLPS